MSTSTQVIAAGRPKTERMPTTPPSTRSTTAFFVQAAISFAISVVSVTYAIAHLPGDAWMRGFLWLGLMYVVTSTFTLGKCVRDQQEAANVISRVDQVRLERLLAEYDPFTPSAGGTATRHSAAAHPSATPSALAFPSAPNH